MRKILLVSVAVVLGAAAFSGQAADRKKEEPPAWDVSAAHGPTKKIAFSTDEGTWMDLDVSPDGKTIVFDLLGDIYLLPIEGGEARLIAGGPAFDVQPRFSPDGREIAFTSDRGGGNNIWRMAADGSAPAQVSKEKFRLMNNPVWTPDGQYLIARKHFTGERSLGAGELWMFHRSGGDGLQLTKQKNDQQDQGEPTVSADGRYVYFSEDVSRGPTFQYNKNVHDVVYAIRRLDLKTGEFDNVVATPGGAVRPEASPDGKSLAFVKRVREKTVLHLLDLESGAVRPLWDGLSHDMQEAWAVFGPYANYDWLPDSSGLVIWAQGKLWRVDASTGEPAAIPFRAEVAQTVTAPLRFERKLTTGEFAPKMIRDVATSPDGKTLIFHAVGHLYRKALPDGVPARLTTQQGVYEYQPSFSADGSKLLYTTWSDAGLVTIRERDLVSGGDRALTRTPGFYYGPRYSPDATQIVYSKTGGGGLTGSLWAHERGIHLMPAAGGPSIRIANEGEAPQFNADGSRVYYFTGGGLSKKLMSVGLNGEQPREVFNLKYPDLVSISPDGRWVAFTELFNAYVAPMPTTGNSVALSKDLTGVPVVRVSQDVGSYLHWSQDARSLHWMVGDEYFSRELKELFAFLPGAPKELPKPETAKGIRVGLKIASDAPADTVALVGARIITMRDSENTEEVIEDGTVIVVGDRIQAIGKRADVAIPEAARRIDLAGKTIVPGYVDAHAHVANFGGGVVPQQNWAYYANLAFGVTTAHDPSATSEFVFSQAELVQAGAMVGPRMFSTGTILYGADGDFKASIDSLDDARSHLRRMKALGAFSVKSYNQPRRDQHQQVNQAARELGMLVVEEGGSTLFHNLPMILDGATTIEHNLPVAPLYRDVLELWRGTDVRNTPTLVVSYGGLSGEFWWYARDNVWEDKKLQRFFPRDTLQARSIRRETAPDWDYHHIEVARAAKKLRDAGVRIQTGGHGQLQGMSLNWETWSLTQGGFSNWEALRAATFDGADSIGFGSELGSLEVGKKADLVVLNSNPLERIQATIDTRYVMVNGRLFDIDADMAEVGGRARAAPEFYWQRHGDGQTFGVQFGPTAVCHCPKSGMGHGH
jgi:Tol biopolymer transport system component/imidazolonepropionase-like amidohydrolase